jgi:hypothetical protein
VLNRRSNLYCVILKSHHPMLPIRPFRAFPFGFLRFSGLKMSIESNISTAFFSDRNTFATPKRLYLRQSRVFQQENRAEGLSDLTIDFALPNCWQRVH